ncbi:MAG: hypothetical protein WAZ18_04110 [Alphaproteobacteria bacterium]
MNVYDIADIYVDIIEPALKLGAFGVLVIVVLHFLNVLKHGGSGSGFIGKAYARIWAWAGWLVRHAHAWGHRFLVWLIAAARNAYVTAYDFFSSRN